LRTVYIFGAGASAAEGAPVVRNFLRIAYRLFKEEQSEPGLEIVWEFLEHFYGSRTAIKTGVDLDRYPGIDEIFNIVDWYLLHNQSFSTRFHRARLYDLKTALVKLISMTLDRTLPADSGMHHSFVAGVLGKSDILPTFMDGCGGTDQGTLAALDALNISQLFVEGRRNQAVKTSLLGLDGVDSLDLRANRYTAAAEYALAGIPHNGRAGIINGVTGFFSFKADFRQPESLRQLLQFAVLVADTGEAFHGVVGKDQFKNQLAGFNHSRGVGTDNHTLGHRSYTGRHISLGPLHFDNTNPAGANHVNIL
jgi:hypothetical protein